MTNDYDVAQMALEEMLVFWVEDQGLTRDQALMLAFYQLTGGNAFGAVNAKGDNDYAARIQC